MQPVLPLGGYAGWRYLDRSAEDQIARAARSPIQSREIAYFRDHIGAVQSAADVVRDRRLLTVALGAFGLQDDLPNRAFIERVLADGVVAPEALSNRLADKRYRAFAEAFGFGTALPPRSQSPGFADRIVAQYQRRAFEVAVGAQDPTLRLALAADRELSALAARGLRNDTAWLTILGNPPLRETVETALGLPKSIGRLDIDRQVSAFRQAADRVLGHDQIARFADKPAREDLLRQFTLRAQLAAGPSALTPGMAALSLLRGGI